MDTSELPPHSTHVSLVVEEHLFPRFCLLTGSGMKVRTHSGCSIADLLCGQLGIDPRYLAERIQTIFLDGQVVDHPETAIVRSGSTLALSAAMPGIAGIMLRKCSPYSLMRSQLSYRQQDAPAGSDETVVMLRLFNMLQGEIGAELLRRGIHIAGRAFQDLLHRRPDGFRSGILEVEIDGAAVERDVLFERDWLCGEIVLAVGIGA